MREIATFFHFFPEKPMILFPTGKKISDHYHFFIIRSATSLFLFGTALRYHVIICL